MTDFAQLPSEGERIAKEIVTICASLDLAELRAEMVQRILMKEFFGRMDIDNTFRKLLAVNVIQNLATTVETFVDELHEAKA